MRTGAVVALVVGVIVVLFYATSRGLISSGVSVGPGGRQTGIVAPQPAQNYSGYLAATTAPAVSGILNTAITGLDKAFSGWFGGGRTSTAPAQGANAASPSLSAQPSGPAPAPTTTNQQFIASLAPSTYSDPGSTLVGPQIDPSMQYAVGSAFDYAGLASDNSYDPNASLEFSV